MKEIIIIRVNTLIYGKDQQEEIKRNVMQGLTDGVIVLDKNATVSKVTINNNLKCEIEVLPINNKI